MLLGVDLSGRLQFADLTSTAAYHFLVAGGSGSGKSEWLRTAIAGLIATNTPDTLRVVLIDPKRNAFNALADSPFLLEPIVYPEERSAVEVFRRLVEEMEARYLAMDGADDLRQHIDRSGRPYPRIVCVCDEWFDLISRDAKERKAIEAEVFRLGAKARAAGVHLILATQQPSRETIRGALDANIPARVGLQVQKPIESKMLLNQPGAERLLGHGDLLYKDIGEPRRLQGAYLPPEERDAIFSGQSEALVSAR